MSDTLDLDGWSHRLPTWQRHDRRRPNGPVGRVWHYLAQDRTTLYVTLMALLWLTYFVLRSSIAVVGDTFISYALPRLFIAGCGFVMTLILGFAIQRSERIGLGAALGVTAVLVLLGAYAFTVLNFEVEYFLYPEHREKAINAAKAGENMFWWSYYLDLYLFAAWACMYFTVRYYTGLQAQRQETLRAVALAHEAKLEVLRYQLNPHFLFNTLNAISTLVLKRQTELAEETINRLSTFLRYALDSDPKAEVTLDRELTAIDLYLAIQRVRFGERLKFSVSVSERASRGYVPSLILQPIVENAIKYAVTPQQEGGTIEIHATCVDDDLVIEVLDTGPGLSESAESALRGSGVGLANCRARLAEFYGPAGRLELNNRSPRGLAVRIAIPYREGPCDD